jgi:hypothetical protein
MKLLTTRGMERNKCLCRHHHSHFKSLIYSVDFFDCLFVCLFARWILCILTTLTEIQAV